jgi:glycerol-3-phosphate acyltransferase PlsX
MKKIVISVDAMGGANAPACVVDAINDFLKTSNGVFLKIYGDSSKIKNRLSSLENVEIIHTDKYVSDEEQPIKALKNGRDSSMYRAIQSVKEGKADACISGGNTGALMVMAKTQLGTLNDIKRPAIVNVFPNEKEGVVMLDLGANAECDANHLYQFALMGHCYAKALLQKNNPSIGILNVGTEEYKGRDLEKKTFDLLQNSGLNFKGHVEGYDVTNGTVDVVVTDGFSGNLVVKIAEGTANICKSIIKKSLTDSFFAKIGALLVQKSLRNNFAAVDPKNHNGAMFIGLNGIVVKSHGSSDSTGFLNALNVVTNLTKKDINSEISTLLKHLSDVRSSKSSLFSKIKSGLGIK